MAAFEFPKSRRLLKTADFDRVFARRRSRSDGCLVLHACGNDLPYCRLGLVVSRKCGNAVRRNAWKRRLREAFRLAQSGLPPGLDLVATPRPGARPSTQRLVESFGRLATQLATDLQGGDKRSPQRGAAEPAGPASDGAAP